MNDMKRMTTLSFLTAIVVALSGCSGSAPNSETQDTSPTVAMIGSERISLREFEEAFAKNNGGWDKGVASTLEDRERFLDLYVKFKLKVREARERGLENDPTIQEELKNYGVSIATSYMLDKELVEPNVRKMYNRKIEEIRASHILVRFPNTPPTPADTAAAYAKALEIIAKVPGAAFDSLAVVYSEDQSVSTNRGDLGYFSAGRMVPEFEDGAYSLKAGEHSRVPVRTQFGYHIIKVTDRKPASGSMRVSHIVRRFAPSLEDTTAVTDSTWMIYRQITSGAIAFDSAAQRYSQDPLTASKGGDYGFIERARIPEDIARKFYGNPAGTVFEPIRFPYGYHIFKTTEEKPLPTFEELERELRAQYQSLRYQTDYAAFLHELKKKLQFSLDVPTMYDFTHAFDTTKSPAREGWSDTLRSDLLSRTIITLGGKTFRVQDVVDFINTSGEFKSTLLIPSNIETIVERFTEIKALEHESASVSQRHPEFDKMMKEYEDGVLLFKIEQDEVWDKIDVSDSAMVDYYEANIEQYQLKNLVNVQEILVSSEQTADSLYNRLKNGEDFGTLAQEYTVRVGYNTKKGVWGQLDPRTHAVTEKAWELDIDSVSAPLKLPEGWSIIKPLTKQRERLQEYEEVATEVANSYRETTSTQREEEWVEGLKKKYGAVITKEFLVEAFRRNPVESNTTK